MAIVKLSKHIQVYKLFSGQKDSQIEKPSQVSQALQNVGLKMFVSVIISFPQHKL